MTLDLTKPVQTRDGRKVRILCTDDRGNYPVIGIIECPDKVEDELETWTLSGKAIAWEDGDAVDDLINVPDKGVISPEERNALWALRARGFLVCLWYPDEVEGLDLERLGERVVELGNEAIEQLRGSQQ